MSTTTPRIAWSMLVVAGGLCGCDFERRAAPEIGMNSCVTDAECTDDTRCQESMCVARNVEDPLAVAMQVVPLGADAASVLLDRFVVEGPITREWKLPKAVGVSGHVQGADGPLEAEVRFVPVDVTDGVPTGAIVASTAGSDPPGHYAVQLLPDIDYRMQVQPAARELPPMRRMVNVTGAERIDVDYPPDLKTRDFEVRGAGEGTTLEGKTLLVRAFDRDTGELVSSTATVQDDRVTLVLTPDASALRIELSVEESYLDASRAASPSCDKSAPLFPTLSIDESKLRSKGILELPAYPGRIVYEGTVELCPGAVSTASDVGSLPIALRSTDLQFDDTDTLFASSFAATTTAEVDAGQLRFCVEVVPGTYEVVVTPPSSMACAIFAETRLVSAPDGKMATGVLFELPAPAYLSGTLQTTDGRPLADATIEAQALGRSEGVQLAQDDPSVTQYNRSTQTTSSEDGSFELPVDLGGYDVVVKPSADSGFPWRVLHDVNIGAPKAFLNEIRVKSPVRIDGALRYAGSGSGTALEGAEVRAFAIIEDEFDTERAVPVGKAVADADGHFMLLLSPSTRKGW